MILSWKCIPKNIPIIKNAEGGEGSPRKYFDEGSKLNLAKRKVAPNKYIVAGRYLIQWSIGAIKVYRYAGAKPKLIRSAKESSSLPKSEATFNFLATAPSSKSNKSEQHKRIDPR